MLDIDEHCGQANRWWTRWLPLVLVLSFGCDQDLPIGDPSRAKSPLKVNIVQPTLTENAEKTVRYFGTLKASREQTLGFASGGKISTLPTVNQSFARDSVIASLDTTDLVSRRDSIASELAEVPEVLAGSQRNQQLRQEMEALDQQIDQQTIRAPFDCVVQRVYVAQNSLVRAQSPVAIVVDNSKLKVAIQLPSQIAKLVEENRTYTFILDDTVIEGTLGERAFQEYLPGSIELVFDVKSDMSEISSSLGQTVEARLQFPLGVRGYRLPLSALKQNSNGLWTVFVVNRDADSRSVEQMLVEVVQFQDAEVLVSTDLNNKLVVRDGIHRIVAGQKVDFDVVTLKPANNRLPVAE